jgi:hypothetical protein
MSNLVDQLDKDRIQEMMAFAATPSESQQNAVMPIIGLIFRSDELNEIDTEQAALTPMVP